MTVTTRMRNRGIKAASGILRLRIRFMIRIFTSSGQPLRFNFLHIACIHAIEVTPD